MERLADSGRLYRRSSGVVPPAGCAAGRLAPVKLEIEMEDELEEENAPLEKRMKQPSRPDQWIAGNDLSLAAQYNPLAEPSPLGLRLKKSPSLLELIQMRLSQGNTSTLGSKSIQNSNPVEIVGSGTTAATCSNDKLKASNFAASLLRIGHWEYATKYEGDLVAKSYFAKHKLVWEILDGGLKSKIEIQWSDIMGLNAKFPEDGPAPATMTVVLARQPLFFRETNPQPRKHTLWQATADFTDGQASVHRQHFLEIPNGVLNKHFEKLIQCDVRLNFLSHQPEMVIDSPYFESLPLCLKDSRNNLSMHNVDQSLGTSISASSNGLPSVSQSSSVNTQKNYSKREYLSNETSSPSSGCVSSDTETQPGSNNWEQLVMQGLRPSMSMTDLVNHIGNCISGERITEEGSQSHKILEDIAQHLLCDSQIATCSDEKSLMSRVNSLCCLLQKDGTPVQINEGSEDQKDTTEGNAVESSSFKPAMSRKDSYGDLLLSLPRITSLPKFLFDISEDGENQAR